MNQLLHEAGYEVSFRPTLNSKYVPALCQSATYSEGLISRLTTNPTVLQLPQRMCTQHEEIETMLKQSPAWTKAILHSTTGGEHRCKTHTKSMHNIYTYIFYRTNILLSAPGSSNIQGLNPLFVSSSLRVVTRAAPKHVGTIRLHLNKCCCRKNLNCTRIRFARCMNPRGVCSRLQR